MFLLRKRVARHDRSPGAAGGGRTGKHHRAYAAPHMPYAVRVYSSMPPPELHGTRLWEYPETRTADDNRAPCGERHARKAYANLSSHMRMTITTATRMMSSTVKMRFNSLSIPPGIKELTCAATWCN